MEQQVTFEQMPALVQTLNASVNGLANMLKEQQHTLAMMQQSMNSARPATDRWLDLDGLIEYLPDHPKRQTVYQWVSGKKIPHTKTGNRLRFRQSSIDRWLDTGTHKSTADIQQAAAELETRQNARRWKH